MAAERRKMLAECCEEREFGPNLANLAGNLGRVQASNAAEAAYIKK